MCVAIRSSNDKICEVDINETEMTMAIDPTIKADTTTATTRSRRRSSSGSSSSSKRVRTYVVHDYQDHLNDPIYRPGENEEEEVEAPKRRGPRGGVVVPFPERLYTMLNQVEEDGYEEVVSWQPHGRCFIVHEPKRFVDEVMPKYFRQSKLTSFQRQVNLYGFRRLTAGKDRGAYYHELFLRGRPDLHKKLVRIRVKGTGFKSASSPATEPNFYIYPRCSEGSGAAAAAKHFIDTTPRAEQQGSMDSYESEMPPIQPSVTVEPVTSTSLPPMLDIPMNPSWKPLSAPPKMMVVTPQLKPIEPPTMASFVGDSSSSSSSFSFGQMTLSSLAKEIAASRASMLSPEHEQPQEEEGPCPVTPESNIRQMVTSGLEQALALVSPVDSPLPSPFPSMLSLGDVPTNIGIQQQGGVPAPIPDLMDTQMDTFHEGIQALLSSDLGEFNVEFNLENNALMIDTPSSPEVDDALDPLFLLDDVVGLAH